MTTAAARERDDLHTRLEDAIDRLRRAQKATDALEYRNALRGLEDALGEFTRVVLGPRFPDLGGED